MPGEPQGWSSDWTVGIRVWVERSGRAILGKGRLELLEAIDRWHSISEAARQMAMSYRRAWLLVHSMNEAAGEALVESATGGSHGGGAHLTPRARWAMRIFREVQERLHQTAAVLLPGLVQGTGAATVHVAAAVSLEEVLGQLLTDYALRQPAVRVRTVFGASDELADHLLAGGPGDLFLAADVRQLHRLEAAHLVQMGTRAVLAENCLAAVGPAEGTARVRKPADLVRPEVARLALAQPTSPLGGYTRAYLQGLGLYEAVVPRAVHLDNSRSVVSAVRAGQADVGLVYGSDAINAAGCRLLFRVRRAAAAIRYVGAVVHRGQQAEQAGHLLEFLTSRPAASRYRRCGLIPFRDHA
jgi:molybdenum ABC transporter molybdate-binding protein